MARSGEELSQILCWLEPRLEAAPASLRARIVAAAEAPRASADPVPTVLADVAERLLDEALQGSPTPDAALTLLAADAVITLACVALAEDAPQALVALT